MNSNKKRSRRAVRWAPVPDRENVPIAQAKVNIVLQETWQRRKEEISEACIQIRMHTHF